MSFLSTHYNKHSCAKKERQERQKKKKKGARKERREKKGEALLSWLLKKNDCIKSGTKHFYAIRG